MSTNKDDSNGQSVNSTERPTPETDELEIIMDRADTPPLVKLMPYAHLCRRLERERDEAREQLRAESNLAYERTRLYHDEWNKNAELIDELAAERALADRLGEALANISGYFGLFWIDDAQSAIASALAAHRAARGSQPPHAPDCICAWCEVDRQNSAARGKEQG